MISGEWYNRILPHQLTSQVHSVYVTPNAHRSVFGILPNACDAIAIQACNGGDQAP